MNTKILGMCLASALCAARVPTGRAAETVAHFPLDADARSVVFADRNADSVVTHLEPGYAAEIAYDSDVKAKTVCDRFGNPLSENAGCLRLAFARLAIDLNRFPLSNDVETVTVEMFVKGGKELGSYFPFFALAPFADDELGNNAPLQTPQVNVVPSGDGKVFAYVRAESASGQEVFANETRFWTASGITWPSCFVRTPRAARKPCGIGTTALSRRTTIRAGGGAAPGWTAVTRCGLSWAAGAARSSLTRSG